jgi:hypothetical protein
MARDTFFVRHALPTRSFKAKRIGAPTTREPKREGGNNNSKASIGDAGQPECWIQDRDGDVAS